MTEDKPIAKPIIDDATREKMALMFSGEVYLPDDVDGFFDLQAAQRDLQLELNATPLTNPKRRTELMQAFFGAAGEGLYLECPVYANWGCNTYWGERCYANFNLTLVDDGEIFIGSHTMIGPNVTLVATGHPVRPDLRYQGAQYSLPVHIGENVWIGAGMVWRAMAVSSSNCLMNLKCSTNGWAGSKAILLVRRADSARVSSSWKK